MMDDFAYSMRCTYHSLSDLQAAAVGGKYGKQPGVVRPFQTLSTRKLQDELRARNIYHVYNKMQFAKQDFQGSKRCSESTNTFTGKPRSRPLQYAPWPILYTRL